MATRWPYKSLARHLMGLVIRTHRRGRGRLQGRLSFALILLVPVCLASVNIARLWRGQPLQAPSFWRRFLNEHHAPGLSQANEQTIHETHPRHTGKYRDLSHIGAIAEAWQRRRPSAVCGVRGRTPQPVSILAEWEKGFCHTHFSWKNPLHSGQNIF